MYKLFAVIFCLCFSLLATAQKIEIEHSDKTPKPSVLKEGKFKVFLVNDTDAPIHLFSSHHKEYGGCETTSEKQIDGKVVSNTNKWKPMDTNSRFDTRAFSTVKPNSKKFIATLSIKDKKPGTYLLKYRINQDPSTVDSRYAKNSAAASKAANITKMDIEGVFEYTIAPLEKKAFVPREISFEDLKKERRHKDFTEAEFDPSSIFAMSLTIKSSQDAAEQFGKLAALKNVRKLSLTIDVTEPIQLPASISALPLMDFSLDVRKKSLGMVTLPADFLSTGELRIVYIYGLTTQKLTFLGKHTQMEELTLRNCDLSDFDWIGNLTKLTKIYITESSLPSLPESFSQLTNLKALSLIKTKVTSIDNLPSSSNLAKLVLTENSITSLPASITQLTGLTTLEASKNKIAALPADLKGMTSLKKVNLSSNNLPAFPMGLTTVTSLEEVQLAENKISKVPSELKKLPTLKVLDLSKNSLTAFPISLKSSPVLSTLKLNNNKITTVPDGIVEFKKLRNFYFENNKIEELPKAFFGMRLYSIYSKGNPLAKRQTKKLKKKFGRKLKS